MYPQIAIITKTRFIIISLMSKTNLHFASYLFVLIALSSAFLIEQNYQQRGMVIESNSNLGFGNQTGSNTSQAQVTSFINFINSASIAYRDDPYSRLLYISNQMNITYSTQEYGFSIIQQGNDGFGFAINTVNNNYASVAPGTDRVFLNNSYMFVKQRVHESGRVYINQPGQKGNVDSDLQNTITNTILQVQTGASCNTCSSSKNIANKLSSLGLGDWNVFCSASSNLYLSVYDYNGKYIFTKPKNCYYGLYEIKQQ